MPATLTSTPPWRAAHVRSRAPNASPHVIVADDDAQMRRLVVEALQGDGCVVEAVDSGGRLLVELTQQIARGLQHVDLIVTDIRMPVASGLQIIEALRSAHFWTPVILMTAFGDEATRAHAERLGALLFDKPFDIDDLRTAAINMIHPPDPSVPSPPPYR